LGPELCEKIKEPDGGWVEYIWPKPGQEAPSRKVTYALKVEGTPYVVDASIYDDAVTIEEPERLSSSDSWGETLGVVRGFIKN
jgi:cytochrome c